MCLNTLRNIMAVNVASCCRSFSSRLAAFSIVDDFWVASDEIK